jgi:5-formyltetrahydrofolate cyclo-ligase
MAEDPRGLTPPSADDVLRRRVKAELRKRMRGLRKAFPQQACSERSARICERLEGLEPLSNAKSVALFWPLEERHEVDLRPLYWRLTRRGVRVALPRLDEEATTMTLRFVDDPGRLVEGPLGLLEPSPEQPPALPGDLEVIVVPALALDLRGHRIGYGRGHYDRTLPAFAPPASTVGVAFDFQIMAEVPVTEGDVAVGWIVTDSRAVAGG